MKKRILSFLMAIVLLIGIAPTAFAADAESKKSDLAVGKINLFSENAPTTERWTAALFKDELIMMTPSTLATIAGAKLTTGDGSIVFDRRGYCVEVGINAKSADVYTDLGDGTHVTLYGGRFWLDAVCIEEIAGKETVFLPMEQLLYLLNVQWMCVENCVYTIASQDTIWSVLADWTTIFSELPNRVDLSGEGFWAQAGTYAKYASLAFLDEINPLFFVPGISVDEKHLEETLLTLGEPLTGSTAEVQQSFAQKLPYYVSDAYQALNGLCGAADGVLSAKDIVTRFLDKAGDALPDGKYTTNVVFAGVDLASELIQTTLATKRYLSWGEDYLTQLQYLSKLDPDAVPQYLTKVAGNLYKETEANFGTYVSEEVFTTLGVAARAAVGLTLYGQITSIYNLSISALKLFPSVDSAFQAGDDFYNCMNLYGIATAMRRSIANIADSAARRPAESLAELRTVTSILFGSAAHCWDKFAAVSESGKNESDLAMGAERAGYYGAMLARLNETALFDKTLVINREYTNLYSEENGAHREKIPPEYVTFDVPSILASPIGEYKGVIYSISEVPNSGFTLLPATAPEGYYVSTFAFYHNYLYYYCKEPGTWDYITRLYRAKPDGSEAELVKDFGPGGNENMFHIHEDGKLYPWNGSEYYDTNKEELVETYDEIGFHPGALPEYFNAEYCVTYGKGGYDILPYWIDDTGRLNYNYEDMTEIVSIEARWKTIVNIVSDAVYYQEDVGNTAYFYRYDIESGATEVVDSKQTAGSGGYFNW